MPKKYIAYIKQRVVVRAKNMPAAKKLIRANPPYRSLTGTDKDGGFSLDATERVAILAIWKIKPRIRKKSVDCDEAGN